jgi:hypothetical protein
MNIETPYPLTNHPSSIPLPVNQAQCEEYYLILLLFLILTSSYPVHSLIQIKENDTLKEDIHGCWRFLDLRKG